MNDFEYARFPVELRVPDVSERIVEGVVVPWDETSYLTPEPAGERFKRGSLTRTIKDRGARIKLFRGHDHGTAIGRALGWEPSHDQGLFGRFRMFDTPAGEAALQEVREGALDAFSVGFQAVRSGRGEDGAREILEAKLYEASLAPIGAYDGARVLAVRTPAPVDLPAMPDVNLEPLPLLARWDA
jgi:uncharacterized protein